MWQFVSATMTALAPLCPPISLINAQIAYININLLAFITVTTQDLHVRQHVGTDIGSEYESGSLALPIQPAFTDNVPGT